MQTPSKPDLRENRPHGTSIFPCAFYLFLGSAIRLRVKHHWHEEIEIIYLKSGNFNLTINMESYDVKNECFIFINRGELHSLHSSTHDFEEQAIVFDPQMLRFQNYDAIDEHILQPVIQGNLTFPKILDCTHPVFQLFKQEYQKVHDAFCRNQNIDITGGQIYTNDSVAQLQIKSSILAMLALLMEHDMMCHNIQLDNQRIESIKTVLAYIRAHYPEKLYIQDLSSLVNMNQQYFCRFFKKAIGKPPIDYINDYRLNKVIHLLEDTELPVTEISLDCGFYNMGNFQRLFKRKTGTTPLQYRKTKQANKSK